MRNHLGPGLWTWRLLFFLLLFASCGIASATGAASENRSGVVIDSDGGKISVRILQPSSLQSVLEVFCLRTQTRCERTEQAAQISIQPQTFSAIWLDAVSRLLQNSKLTYVASPPTSSSPGRLRISPPDVWRDGLAEEAARVYAASGATAKAARSGTKKSAASPFSPSSSSAAEVDHSTKAGRSKETKPQN